MKMPFGKFRGLDLTDIAEEHTGYFIWLTTIELTGELKKEVEQLNLVYKQEIEAHIQDSQLYYDGLIDLRSIY
jgi:uncharacterized protein (DUF3820 family)